MFRQLAAVLLISLLFSFSHSQGQDSPSVSRKPAAAAKPAKPAPKKESKATDDLQVDGVEPLFLEKTNDPQTIHLIGKFPGINDLQVIPAPPLSIVDEQQDIFVAPPSDLFINVVLNPAEKGKVTLALKSKANTVPITLEVRESCPAPPSAPAVPAQPALGGNGFCAIPKADYAINALTKAKTTAVSDAFCTNHETTSNFPLKSTRLSPNSAVQILVCNKNPFHYSTKLVVDEQAIEDDDITTFLGFLDPLLGATTAANTAKDNASSKTNAQNITKNVLNKSAAAAHAFALVPKVFEIKDPVQGCLSTIIKRLQKTEQDYITLASSYRGLKAHIEDDSIDCAERVRAAQQLWSDANGLVSSPDLRVTDEFITSINSEIDQRLDIASSGPFKQAPLTTQQIASMNAVKKALAVQICIATQTGSLLETKIGAKVLDPLSDILGDPSHFVYLSPVLGPYPQPTSANWKVISTKSTGLAAGGDISGDPYRDCLMPPKQAQPGNTDQSSSSVFYKAAPPAFMPAVFWTTVQKSKKNPPQGGPQGGQAPAGGAAQTPPTTPAPAPPPEEVQLARGTLTFGGPRLMVSAGLATVFMRKQEFQKAIGQALDANGQPISGKEAVNTIQLKTDDRIVPSPLIMAHARLFSFRGSDNALWGTIGVTGRPDNQGTAVEYLFGVSQSLLNNWIFITPGLYLGKQQSLTPGLRIGQEVPSALAGDPTIQKKYVPRFAISVSFHLPKTAAPKTQSTDSTSTSSKKSDGTSGKNKNN